MFVRWSTGPPKPTSRVFVRLQPGVVSKVKKSHDNTTCSIWSLELRIGQYLYAKGLGGSGGKTESCVPQTELMSFPEVVPH